MDPIELVLVAIVGLVAGAVNTVAGGGSLLTLPVLIVLGLPAHVANGTNRVGVALQSASSTWAFHKTNGLEWKLAARLVIPSSIGALVGAFVSLDLDEALFKKIIGVVMVLVLAIMLLEPKKWLAKRAKAKREASEQAVERAEGAGPTVPIWLQMVIFAGIGFYGGFLQAGVGFFLLAGLNLASDLDLVKANAVKVVLVLAYTLLAIPVFAWHGQIDWLAGGALAAGSFAGGWVGTKMTVSWGPTFVKIVLVLVVSISATRLLGLW